MDFGASAALASGFALLAVVSGAMALGYKFGSAQERDRLGKIAARVRDSALRNMVPGSRRDMLTGLLGREEFLDKLSAITSSGEPHLLMVVDIDDFTELNETIGFSRGDQVLASIGQRLAGLNLAGQWGRLATDVFAIALPSIQSLPAVEGFALTVIRAFNDPITLVDGSIACSVGLGAALLPQNADSCDTALRAGYSALRNAKSKGRSRWVIYDPAVDDYARERKLLKADLLEAIDNGHIVPYYQPIVDLEDGTVVGLEVLARWNHPSKGFLPPDLFIPMAEEMNLADRLTQVLMRNVALDARLWPPQIYLAFNIAPCQLRELISFIQNPPKWADAIAPERLAIEITESALIEDIELARELIDLLQARGTQVVLDDFGIGYSNFFHLRELPFNRLKIDKSFILDCAYDPRADACLRAMLAVAASLDIAMVAEGLERPEIAAYMARLGCKYGQGYLYSRPVPASGVPALLTNIKALPRQAIAA